MPPRPKKLPFPASGLHEDAGYDLQPPLTTTEITNVRAHDVFKDRIRGGRRPGLSKHHSAQINGDDAIQHITKIVKPVAYGHVVGEQILIAGGSGSDSMAAAFTADGTAVFEYDTGNSADSIARDAEENFYIGGAPSSTWTDNDGSTKDVWAVSKSGTVLWTFFGGTGGTTLGVVYDPVNDVVYVAGTRTNDWTGSGGANASLWQHDPSDGSVNWAFDLGNTGWSVNVDSEGNVFATAFANSSWTGAGGTTASVWKLNSSGSVLQTYNTGASTLPKVSSVGSSGDVLVGLDDTTAVWSGTDGSDKNIFRLDNDLSLQETWDMHSGSSLRSLEFMANDNYLVAGGTVSSHQLRKFNSAGQVWEFFVGPNQTSTCAAAVTVDDNVAVFMKSNANWDGTTGTASYLLLDSDGAVLDSADPAEAQTGSVSNAINEVVVASSSTGLSTREASLIVVAGGTVKKLLDGTLSTPTSGSDALTDQPFRVNAVPLYQDVFFVDGSNSKLYDLGDDEVKTWSATSGILPASCRLIARYRGRAVLSGKVSDPANWFMSEVGDPFNWDFSPTTTTATQAVAGNASDAGLVGDVVTALMPFDDDAMLIGCDQSLWQMSGDPAAGGSLDMLSDKIGVAWNAWTQGPDGAIYFLGIDGVYRVTPGQQPAKLTGNRLDDRFRNIDHTAVRALLGWDLQRQGLILTLATPLTGQQTSYFWSSRVDAWTVDEYPSAMGPSFLYAYDLEEADDTDMLLGCKDGYIRKVDDSATDDDGTSIDATVRYAPIMLTDGRTDGILSSVDVTLASNSDDATLKVYTGQTAEECATNTTARLSRTIDAGRNLLNTHRIRGRYVQLEISSDTAVRWAIESVNVTVAPSGAGRHKRG